jgi:hypothetical protein
MKIPLNIDLTNFERDSDCNEETRYQEEEWKEDRQDLMHFMEELNWNNIPEPITRAFTNLVTYFERKDEQRQVTRKRLATRHQCT